MNPLTLPSRVLARVRREHRDDRALWPVTFVLAAALLAIQVASGAYQSEFTGAPDEPGHFITALMVYDYLTAMPRENPVDWAGRFFLHYPHVGLGQWPPGYFVLVSLWWLITGPGRTTALLFQWLTALVSLVLFYRLARREVPLPASAAMLAGVVATPVFHEALSRTMADSLCFLWGVLLLQFTRDFSIGASGSPGRLGVTWVCGALTKGTIACLTPAPALAWLAGSNHPARRWRTVVLAAVCGGALVAIAFQLREAVYLGGVNFSLPWRPDSFVAMTGWGVLALAALGVRREPLPVTAASIVVSALISSYFIRAMRTDRHWIVVLPAVALLAGLALSRVRPRWLLAPLCALALILFPWRFDRQHPAGYAAALARIPRPARMLVSSNGSAEPEIAAVAAGTERRPGSMVARSTKVLADTGRQGRTYRSLVSQPEQVEQRLDELAIGAVMIHTIPLQAVREHQSLLKAAVAGSGSWKLCHEAPGMEVYCRIAPPRFPRKALRITARQWTFEERLPE